MKYTISVCLLVFCFITKIQAQSEYKCFFKYGEPCPDFTFNNVDNYFKKAVTLKDFKGKWLILDFWNKSCSSCIASMPSLNKKQKKYKDNIQFLFVGLQDKKGEINLLWNRLKRDMHLTIPAVFDSVWMTQVNELSHGMPFKVVIDPDGIVRGSCSSLENIGANFDSLTLNNRPNFQDYFREIYERSRISLQQSKYDRKQPLLVDNNGGDDGDHIFRSLLAKWSPVNPVLRPDSIGAKTGRFEFSGSDGIGELYKYAYGGFRYLDVTNPMYRQYWPEPILHLDDSSLFAGHLDDVFVYNKPEAENSYIYTLKVPPNLANRVSMMKIMQADLKNYFGYEVRIEEREMPYWSLAASDKAREKLRSKSNVSQSSFPPEGEWFGFSVINFPITTLISRLKYVSHIQDLGDWPLLDDTGINGNIDLTMDHTPFDLNSILASLRKSGLDIIKSSKKFKVIIISDPLK